MSAVRCLSPSRSLRSWALLPIGCLTLWSCGGSSGSPVGPVAKPAVASVIVTPASSSLLQLGASVQLEAVARDAAGGELSGKVFSWSSSDEEVATVNATGVVTAMANGGVTITATTEEVAGSAAVTVQAPTTGSLRVITTTVGRNLDPDGYTFVLNGLGIQAMSLEDTVTIGDLQPGEYTAALSGLAATCYDFGPKTISTNVTAGGVTDVLLGVECLGVPDDVALVFARSVLDPPGLNIVGLPEGETEPVQLTFQPAFDRDPDWSSDGTRLAFTRNGVIHVVNADGTGLRALVEGVNPDWSPAGDRIAFDNGSRTFVVEVDGATAQTFIGDGTGPAWSPDGTRIAVDDLVTQNQTDIFLMDASGANRVNITDNAMRADREPVWSPDGSRIVFRRLNRFESSGYDLWMMEDDGSNVTELLVMPGPQTGPVWLPDDRIIFDSSGRILALDLVGGGTADVLVSEGDGINYFGATWREVP